MSKYASEGTGQITAIFAVSCIDCAIYDDTYSIVASCRSHFVSKIRELGWRQKVRNGRKFWVCPDCLEQPAAGDGE